MMPPDADPVTAAAEAAQGPLCARWDPLLAVLEYGCAHQSCLTAAAGEPRHRGWDLTWILEREDDTHDH